MLRKSEKTPRYFKLPYIGRYSDYTNMKFVKIVENLCKENIRIKLIFTPFKINTFFFKQRFSNKCVEIKSSL